MEKFFPVKYNQNKIAKKSPQSYFPSINNSSLNINININVDKEAIDAIYDRSELLLDKLSDLIIHLEDVAQRKQANKIKVPDVKLGRR